MSDIKSRMFERAQRAALQGDLRRTRERVAGVQSNEYDGARWIALADIQADPRIQVRTGGLNEDTVHRYATIMFENQSYAPFPPLELYRGEGAEALWLSAGFHRRAAIELADQWLVEAGLEPINGADAYVRPGGWEAAYWNAITDNLKNGLQMSTADLKNALYRLMGYDVSLPEDGEVVEIARMSNRQLASLLGVSHTTIRKWLAEFERQALASGNQFPDTTPKRLVQRGGQIYEQDISNIQAANQIRAAREALEKLSLPRLEPGSTEHEGAKALISWLQTSLRDFKHQAGEGCRLRRYLPYALIAELDSDEPRVSYVNWMRVELPKWQEEQEQERQAEIEHEKAERRARGTHFDLRGRDEQEAIVVEMSDKILTALRQTGGPLREIELRAELNDPSRKPFSLAIAYLQQEGLIVEAGDARGSRSYRLAPEPPLNTDYQADKRELDLETNSDWLDRQVARAQGLDALDVDLAAKLSELLHVGEMVEGHLERVLEQPGPLPEWLLPKLNELSALLHGRHIEDTRLWQPGLNRLVDDLHSKHFNEKGKGQ